MNVLKKLYNKFDKVSLLMKSVEDKINSLLMIKNMKHTNMN